MTHTSPAKPTDLSYWIDMLDALPLECDGLSRAVSSLLHREGISHTLHRGSVTVEGAGEIYPHLWVELDDGRILDLRARMWLREKEGVPHGLFMPDSRHAYISHGTLDVTQEHPIIFWALTNKFLHEFPTGLREAFAVPEALLSRRNTPR